MEEIDIARGAYGQELEFTIEDDNGIAYNLGGYTVVFKLARPATPEDYILEEDCTVDDAAGGTCYYTVQEGDFDEATTYAGKLVATATGKEEITKTFRLVVTE